MINIGLFNKTSEEIKEFDDLKDMLEYALKHEKIDSCEFNVILVSNNEIKEINKNYRNKDAVTDVISFALEDDKNFIFSDHRILGDIYISLEQTKKQAEDYGHSLKREINFLALHGLLHLLGYDHMTNDDEKIMFRKQEEILDGFGIKR